MRKTSPLWSCIKWTESAVLLVMIISIAIDTWEAWQSPQRYPFGAEGPVANLWAYESQRNYLLASGFALAACCLAMIGIWLRQAPRLIRWLCVAPLLAVAVQTIHEWLIAFE